ncbi:MAG TPA: N-6 DNA methylase [Solirubrobacterales bacterium]
MDASTKAIERIVKAATQRAVQADDAQAHAAFATWRRAMQFAGMANDWDTFASEAAFSAVARAALEVRISNPDLRLDALFPHLYSSPFFSWHRLPVDDVARDALSGTAGVDSTELLSWIYQFAIPSTMRKKFGHFYTPPAVVDSMLDSVGFSGPEILGKRFIDPAVGAGAFAIGATRRLIAEAEGENLGGIDVWRAVQGAIFGLDVNPLGILLTEAAVGLLLADHLVDIRNENVQPLHFYVTDSLSLDESSSDIRSHEAEEIKGRTGAYESGFHFVVANPPYAKYSSRRLSQDQRSRFSATTYGHPNLYGLFLQVGVELLANDGRLVFITPKSFVSGLYFKNLRRYLAENLDFERFDTFDRRRGLFPDVLQDVVILSGGRRVSRQQRKEIEIREFSGHDRKPKRCIRIPSESVLLGPRFSSSFYVDADELAHQLLGRMSEDSVPMADLGIKVRTGTVVWNRLKQHMRDAPLPDALPLIWGSGIRQFNFKGLGNRDGQATHALLDEKTSRIVTRGDALLVKRMTAKEEVRRLVACRVPEYLATSKAGYFAENHVNVLIPEAEAEIELDAVLGLLNSSLFDYVFRSLNGNTQVSATELAMLPVKRGAELQAIAAQVRKLTASGGANAKAKERIEELISQLYSLDELELAGLNEAYSIAS